MSSQVRQPSFETALTGDENPATVASNTAPSPSFLRVLVIKDIFIAPVF
jgi:hypothetical protein